jgi:hypothetical protein
MMMWASRRGADGSVQLWLADFVMELDRKPQAHDPSSGH